MTTFFPFIFLVLIFLVIIVTLILLDIINSSPSLAWSFFIIWFIIILLNWSFIIKYFYICLFRTTNSLFLMRSLLFARFNDLFTWYHAFLCTSILFLFLSLMSDLLVFFIFFLIIFNSTIIILVTIIFITIYNFIISSSFKPAFSTFSISTLASSVIILLLMIPLSIHVFIFFLISKILNFEITLPCLLVSWRLFLGILLLFDLWIIFLWFMRRRSNSFSLILLNILCFLVSFHE